MSESASRSCIKFFHSPKYIKLFMYSGSIILLGWYFLHLWLNPAMTDSLPARLFVSSLGMPFAWLSRSVAWIEKHLATIFHLQIWAAASFIFWLCLANDFSYQTPISFVVAAVILINLLTPGRATQLFSICFSLLPFLSAGYLFFIQNEPSLAKQATYLGFALVTIFTMKHFIFVADEIIATRLEREREANYQNAKWVALGQLSGGIAHEINSPLGSIMLSASHISHTLKENRLNEEILAKQMHQILKTVGRMQKIIHSLKVFNRDPNTIEKGNFSLFEILEETQTILSPVLKHSSVKIEFDPDALNQVDVHCNETEIIQILLNLFDNAICAMEQQKEKRIRLSLSHPSRGNEGLTLVVSDNGSGIAPRLRQHIFTPFFSTKELGKGTGLGLSLAQELAHNNEARLFLSDKSEETSFHLTFYNFKIVKGRPSPTDEPPAVA